MTSPRTGARVLAAVLAATAVTAGCGLKPEATDSLKAPGAAAAAVNGSGTGTTGTGTAAGAPGSATGSGTAAGAPGAPIAGASGTGGTTTGGTTTGGGATSGGGTVGGPAPSSGGPCGVPTGGSTTGITSSSINIGVHAPLTGTGTPFPNNSFQAGASKFWDQPGHEVCGRKIHVEFQDDTYTPSGAHNVCSQMATRDFFVVGGGGTDQIQACATDPNIQRYGVPYLSAGVTDNGLTSLQNYFAVSLTYKQQGGLVLRNAKTQHIDNPSPSNQDSDNMPGHKAVWAIVTGNSPNFNGARDGMAAALNAAHIPYKYFPANQQGNYQPDATQQGQQLALAGFKTIFVDAAPGYFVFMSKGYYNASTTNVANWVGPGVTYTEVTVAQYICASPQISGHAWFLAPGPGLDRATDDFKKAYGSSYDDIEWALWGLSETLFALLKNASANLTRENFIAATERAVVPSKSYAAVDFRNHGGHFGGTGAWVQRVNCNRSEPGQNEPGYWETVGTSPLSL